MVSFRATFLALLSAPLLALAQTSTANPPKVPEGFSAVAGTPLSLSWTPTTSGTVTLVLRSGASSDLEQGSVIASDIPNSGSYTWDVPSDIVRGSDYTVEIVSDSDSTATNYWPYFVIDSTVTVATTTASTVTLGAPTSSVSVSSALPTATAVVSGSSLNSVLSTASLSPSSTSGSSSGSMTTSASTTASSSTTSSSDAAGFQATSASSTGTTPNAAPRATAMAGLLGVVALGALAL